LPCKSPSPKGGCGGEAAAACAATHFAPANPCSTRLPKYQSEVCLAGKLEHLRMTIVAVNFLSAEFEQPRTVKNITFIKKLRLPAIFRQFSPEFLPHFGHFNPHGLPT
jgi:hypothetical protein